MNYWEHFIIEYMYNCEHFVWNKEQNFRETKVHETFIILNCYQYSVFNGIPGYGLRTIFFSFRSWKRFRNSGFLKFGFTECNINRKHSGFHLIRTYPKILLYGTNFSDHFISKIEIFFLKNRNPIGLDNSMSRKNRGFFRAVYDHH